RGVGLVANARGLLSEGSEVCIVEGTGHFLHVEKPKEVNDRILQFLEEEL
ncbi:MAG: hypothetical protein QOJ09_917, partial [Actinomycetota bacterium]|nr:hypothetical protein [Actinomycetota bacterium]